MASGERKMDISIYEKIYKISDYKTHPIYWLSIYLKGYFKGRYYGPGIEKIEIQMKTIKEHPDIDFLGGNIKWYLSKK
jgi:hypothetical protein